MAGTQTRDPRDALQSASVARYAEGRRVASTCRTCSRPVWIVYHGPNRHHTIEPREEARPEHDHDVPRGQPLEWHPEQVRAALIGSIPPEDYDGA
jgi:hypothetical protein